MCVYVCVCDSYQIYPICASERKKVKKAYCAITNHFSFFAATVAANMIND